MCGIAGAAWTAGSPALDVTVLQRMTTVLAHRGPDDAGYFHSLHGLQDRAGRPLAMPAADSGAFTPHASNSIHTPHQAPGVALGHRRLSIIDLAGGHQPLCNEDGTVWITFNGEVYNYRELQTDLEGRGHRFRTSSDTETIVHLYEEHGADCVQFLRGMFAFAIWDDRKKLLFLARDRLGKKPLVYRHEPRRLLFASELKALLQVPGVPRQLDPRALDAYLTYQYVPHPECILQGFHKLPPAHCATYCNGQLEVRRYWRPGYEAGTTAPSATMPTNGAARAWQSSLRETLTEAVRLRMRSDVPLGAFLSGGMDSTIIAGLMQSLSDRPIQTFSIGFPVKAFDERTFAREAARHLGTEHHEQLVEPAALQILPRLIWQYDEPFADSSAIPTLYLADMTRQQVTVALSGDGGDELFAGYDRYQAVKLGAKFDRLPWPLRKLLTARVWQSIPASVRQKSRRRRLKRLLSALGDPPERRYLKWISIFDDDRRPGLYTPDVQAQLTGVDSARFLLDAYQECPQRDFVTRTTCADLLTYLPCDILTKVDIATMTHALEARCPFLDHHVVELAARMPLDLKIRGRQGKQILLDTFRDLLPAATQTRAKMGFGVPLDHWFRHELRGLLQDVLLDPVSLQRGLFRPAAIEQLVQEHIAGRWDHSYRLWSLLVLELWQQTFLDPVQPPAAPAVHLVQSHPTAALAAR